MRYRNYKWLLSGILLFAVWTVGIQQAHATSCLGGLVNVWPASGTTVPTNGVFLVEGYSNEAETILALPKNRPKLTSASGSVALDVIKVFQTTGRGFEFAAAVLKPVQALEPGVKYTLTLTHIDRRQIIRGSTRARGREGGKPSTRVEDEYRVSDRVVLDAEFRVGKTADSLAPRWLKQPKITGASRARPTGNKLIQGVRVQARASTAKKGEVFYVARVTNLKDPKDKQEYPIFDGVARGEVYIGNGICESKFVFQPDAEYQVTLQPVDWARNRGRRSQPFTINPESFEGAENPFRRPTAR